MEKKFLFNNGKTGKVSLIFKNGKVEKIEAFGKEFDKFELLAAASKCENKKDSWGVMNLASTFFHGNDDWAFNTLYEAVASKITAEYNIRELDLYRVFEDKVADIFDGKASILHKKNNPKHIPDSWIVYNGEETPVEMKKRNFDVKALSQLKRYMNFYKCNQGIAVGACLKCKLPENIKFVAIKDFYK